MNHVYSNRQAALAAARLFWLAAQRGDKASRDYWHGVVQQLRGWGKYRAA